MKNKKPTRIKPRYGRVKIKSDFFSTCAPGLWRKLFGNARIYRAEHFMWNDVFEYYMYHPSFNEVKPNREPPHYTAEISGKGKNTTITWMKVDNPCNLIKQAGKLYLS